MRAPRRASYLPWILCLCVASACSNAKDPAQKPLVVFAAASLAPWLDAKATEFTAQHPKVDLRIEYSGSIVAVNKVVHQGRHADLLLVADQNLLRDRLATAFHFSLGFANNALVLAYSKNSPLAPRLERGEPWQKVLLAPSAAIAIANPDYAPAGRRALLALRLNDLLAPEPLRTGEEIRARLLPRHRRPDVAMLIPALQSGNVDAAFVYRSQAKIHGLDYVALDPRVGFEATVSDDVSTMLGSAADRLPLVYAMTLPNVAKDNHPLVLSLIQSLLAPENSDANIAFEILPPKQRPLYGRLPAGLESPADFP